MNSKPWVWMPHAGHLLVGNQCRFHLATAVNGYIVSTVGEYWPSRAGREIHAHVYDPNWLVENKHRLGDDFDYAYFKRFGYESIGGDRTYETMVFKAKKSTRPCCPFHMVSGELDFFGYNDPGDAYHGHLKLCKKWSKKLP